MNVKKVWIEKLWNRVTNMGGSTWDNTAEIAWDINKKFEDLHQGIQKIKDEKDKAYNEFVHAEDSQLDTIKGYHNALVYALKAMGEFGGLIHEENIEVDYEVVE